VKYNTRRTLNQLHKHNISSEAVSSSTGQGVDNTRLLLNKKPKDSCSHGTAMQLKPLLALITSLIQGSLKKNKVTNTVALNFILTSMHTWQMGGVWYTSDLHKAEFMLEV